MSSELRTQKKLEIELRDELRIKDEKIKKLEEFIFIAIKNN